jgi:D-alanyl-D-alanine carboxypeptidase/D-alanyl-D-alanine-endopeptidase (penicillin-binding protein 4)
VRTLLPSRSRRRASLFALALAAAGCAPSASGDVQRPPHPPPTAPRPTATGRPPTVPPATTTTTTTTPSPPAALAAALEARIADPRFADVAVGASVWIEGYGEVLAHDADRALLPASNQKLLTALAAWMTLPADGVFVTEVRAVGTTDAGTVHGDLALVGGGDPTLTRTGPHSLDALAAQVRDAGITRVTGDVVADESRQERARSAEGWQDWQIPTYAGPLSALTVDDNRYRTDAAYLDHPEIGNAEAFAAALRVHGVNVDGGVVSGSAPAMPVVAVLHSRPFPELVAEMLLRSDNEIAEMLTREMGLRVFGQGSTAAGIEVAELALEAGLGVELTGASGDGSGLSRADFRSARELRAILHAALESDWAAQLDEALPVAARSGTLAGRFHGTAAAGNLRAKTGSIIGGRALTGHLTTAGGREVVFSIVVNGEGSPAAQHAIDALVVTLADDLS